MVKAGLSVVRGHSRTAVHRHSARSGDAEDASAGVGIKGERLASEPYTVYYYS